MRNKTRSKNHIIGDKAVSFIKERIIPSEWVVREFTPDYGIDLDIELFEENEKGYSAVGEHVLIQVKGTENAQYGSFELEGRICKVLKFRIETNEINLVSRIGSALPVLLVIVDLSIKKAYQICLNDYISKVLPFQDPEYKNKRSITVNIPIANELSKDNIDVLRLYGKRIKIYSLFQEMNTDIDNFNYFSLPKYLEKGKKFIEKYRQYYIFDDKFPFLYIEEIKKMLDILLHNDYRFEEETKAIKHLIAYNHSAIDENSWKDVPIIINGDEFQSVTAYEGVQIMSIRKLFQYIKDYSGMYETYCRQYMMPCLILGIYEEEN